MELYKKYPNGPTQSFTVNSKLTLSLCMISTSSNLMSTISFKDEYFRSFMQNVDTTDRLIGVDLYNNNSRVESNKNNDGRLIEIKDLVDLDLLRNGLQSAVSIHCQIKTPNQSSARKSASSLPKIGPTFIDTSGQSQDSNTTNANPSKKNTDKEHDDKDDDDEETSKHSSSSSSLLSFNYQLVLALNNDYFRVEQPSNSQIGLMKIRLFRKPMRWNEQDLADLTIQTSNGPRRQNHATGILIYPIIRILKMNFHLFII